MNINKRLDRVKQWAGEKMGADVKTNVSDDFKALELEMALRQDGMEKLHKSTTTYVKSLSKRNDTEDKEKVLPIAYLGQTMMHHGEDFEHDSEFGNCLIMMGRTNDRIARLQETYVANTTSSWLESLERSLAMMREYQSARKKLESRRLAYDASLSKMQKAKKEDFRTEEELRSQKAKYEESSEDVLRRMEDIKEAEADSIADLGSFLDAELEYYDKCRNELLRLKEEWPARGSSPRDSRRANPRSRSNTVRDRYSTYDEAPSLTESELVRPSIRSQTHLPPPRLDTLQDSRLRDEYSQSPSRPYIGRCSTLQAPIPVRGSPIASRQDSMPADVSTLRNQLRQTNRITTSGPDLFSDPSDGSTPTSASPDRSYGTRSVSPATSQDSSSSRTANTKRAPPPPPPSRAKKPPPPPPMKRAAASANSIERY